MKFPGVLCRRQFLYGSGVAMVLPRLESLAEEAADGADDQKTQEPPRRFLGLYVGHGFVITRQEDHPARDWSWYPRVVDGKLRFGKSLAALQPLANEISSFYGLDHPRTPLSNLLLMFLRQLDVPATSFSDSTGIVKEVLA